MPWTQDLTTVSQKKTKKNTSKKQKPEKKTKKNIPCFFFGGWGFPTCALDSGFDDSLAKKNKNKNKTKNELLFFFVFFLVFVCLKCFFDCFFWLFFGNYIFLVFSSICWAVAFITLRIGLT